MGTVRARAAGAAPGQCRVLPGVRVLDGRPPRRGLRTKVSDRRRCLDSARQGRASGCKPDAGRSMKVVEASQSGELDQRESA